MAVLAEAGIEVVGENRAQDLEAKHAVYGDAFRWHFIGHLQSRKAKVVNDLCELVHSLDSESAAKRLTVPALVEVNLSGEATKSGVPPEELGAFLELYPDIRGLMTMPPLADDPEASRPYFRRLRELAEEHGLEELSMGTSQDYRVAAEEGATYVRVGSTLYGRPSMARFAASTPLPFHRTEMGFADLWNRTLVYFGIAEEDDYWDEDGYTTNEELERTYTDARAGKRAPAAPSPARGVRGLVRLGRSRGADRGGPLARRPASRPLRRPHARGGSRRRRARTSRCTSSSRAASTTPSRSRTSSRKAFR